MEVNGFDLIGFDLFGVDFNSIDINTDNSVSVKDDYIPTTIKPYIKGHVTDGSSTFTFTVNGNQSITVPVDANGNWKWVVDRTITGLYKAFSSKTGLNILKIYLPKTVLGSTSAESAFALTGITKMKVKLDFGNVTSLFTAFNGLQIEDFGFLANQTFSNVTQARACFQNCNNVKELIMNEATFAKLTSGQSMFHFMSLVERIILPKATFAQMTTSYELFDRCPNLKEIYMPLAEFGEQSYSGREFFQDSSLESITIKSTKVDLNFAQSPKLTAQSVVNLFNAVAVNGITLTFHSTVGAMIEEQMEIDDSPIYNAYWNKYDEGIEINYTY